MAAPTQNTGWQRRTVPHTFPTAIRRLTTFTHKHQREAAFLRCILAFANTFSPKIKSKSLLCTQGVATSIQLCWISSSQTRAMDPLGSLPAGLAARASSLLSLTRLLNQIQVGLNTRAARFREWSLKDPSLKQQSF